MVAASIKKMRSGQGVARARALANSGDNENPGRKEGPMKRSKGKPSSVSSAAMSLPQVCPDAAGIDIGATSIFAAVPEDRAVPNVRSFATFTSDLESLADWLVSCGIRNVAMEATGVYWIPLFQILEKRGLKAILVNARSVKNVPGRKTDVKDSRWIQFLHAVGLLQASFRPSDEVCALRSYMRHRDKLIGVSASHVLRMQKSLTQMNVQLHNVISDITGVSGLAILDSILQGQRNPEFLASLCDRRIKTDRETVRKSLVGDWRPEHLFTLDQELRAYRFCQELIRECDAMMEALLANSVAAEVLPLSTPNCAEATSSAHASTQDAPSVTAQACQNPVPISKKRGRKISSPITLKEMRLTDGLLKLFGTDLTLVPGLAVDNIYKLFTELGSNLAAFPTGRHFASHLGLCPDNRISGGRVLSAKTRHVPSRAATVFRMAANSLERSKTPLGDYLRRMKARLGKQEGITATAHKIARIFYHLVTTGETYNEAKLQPSQTQIKRREQRLARDAAKLGFTITPISVTQ